MRLRGFSFSGFSGPVTAGFLPVSDFTAVLGANDAGKSRLMHDLSAALDVAHERVELPEGGATERKRSEADDRRSSPPEDRLEDTVVGAPVTVYVELTQSEVTGLLSSTEKGDGRSGSDDSSLKASVDAERARYPDDRLWQLALDEAERTRLFAFPCDGDEPLMWLCLPAPSPLSPKLREKLSAPRHHVEPTARQERIAATAASRPINHDEPVPLISLGRRLVAVPRPVQIPGDADATRGGLADAMTALLRILRCSVGAVEGLTRFTADPLNDDHYDWQIDFVHDLFDDRPAGERTDLWLQPSHVRGLRLTADATLVVELCGRLATRLAPPLVAGDYELRADVTPAEPGGIAVNLQLVRARDHGGPGDLRFGIEDAADGHRVWLELAFTRAVLALNRVARELHGRAERAAGAPEELMSYVAHREEVRRALAAAEAPGNNGGVADAADLEARLNELDGLVAAGTEEAAAAIQAFADGVAILRETDDPLEALSLSDEPSGLWPLRTPFFIVDEPERHLHPRVQQQMATWIRDFTHDVDAGQGVVITHATPFINQADSLAYVSRTGADDAAIRSSTHDELTLLSEVAATVGLERGQLLTDVSVVLFVEGESDRYVLEALFQERLRRAGIVILTLGGATQLPQLADARFVIRFTTAKPAVMLDNLERWEYQRLIDDVEQRRLIAKKGRVEERALARLLESVLPLGQVPEFVELPVKDMHFALDSRCIREVFAELHGTHDVYTTGEREPVVYEEYPGHERARTEQAQSGEPKWKVFLERTYGIPLHDVSWYARVADRMRDEGLIPEALQRVMQRLEELASADRQEREG